MPNQRQYIIQSLELHLFFARIMKEHSLFLEAGFTPPDAALAKKAEWFKSQFESLLSEVVRVSSGAVRPQVLDSGEVVTEFTLQAENLTKKFTGINIDTGITKMELRLQPEMGGEFGNKMFDIVKGINRAAIQLLNGLIDFKERILSDVRSCRMFTMNYPLLIEHILREAKLYHTYVTVLENGNLADQMMRDTERFWNQIMMEHAMFIRGLLDPSEAQLIDSADMFAKDYEALINQARTRSDMASFNLTEASLQETLQFRDFKQAGTAGIQSCEIESIILPLLADHVLREANHYIRLLETH